MRPSMMPAHGRTMELPFDAVKRIAVLPEDIFSPWKEHDLQSSRTSS